MNRSISLSVNPGKVYYNFSLSKAKEFMDKWDGQVYNSGTSLFFVSDKLRIHVSRQGQVKAFIVLEDDYVKGLTHLLKYTLHKVGEFLLSQNSNLESLNVYCPKTHEDQEQIQKTIIGDLSLIFGNCFAMQITRLKSGENCISMNAILQPVYSQPANN